MEARLVRSLSINLTWTLLSPASDWTLLTNRSCKWQNYTKPCRGGITACFCSATLSTLHLCQSSSSCAICKPCKLWWGRNQRRNQMEKRCPTSNSMKICACSISTSLLSVTLARTLKALIIRQLRSQFKACTRSRSYRWSTLIYVASCS